MNFTYLYCPVFGEHYTPFTETTFRKVLNSLLVCYVRMIRKLPKNGDAHEFDGSIDDLLDFVKKRIGTQTDTWLMAEREFRRLAENWLEQIRMRQQEKDRLAYRRDLIRTADEFDEAWSLMQSMREVDTTSVMTITLNPIVTDEDIPSEQIQEAV